MDLPSISIIIPTLNSEKTLPECLNSILKQDYPKEKLEFIITDGGSRDSTQELVQKNLKGIDYKFIFNELKTAEAGKAIGVKNSKNEIIAFIDSDNILPQTDWFYWMIEPFSDSEIIASEPLYYTYRKNDPFITRYCAMLGMNDPLCLFLGNYDRYCSLTEEWTEVVHKEEDFKNYLKVEFPNKGQLPTIGANGFLIRRSILQQYLKGDYLVSNNDLDTNARLLRGLQNNPLKGDSPAIGGTQEGRSPIEIVSDKFFIGDYLFDIDILYDLLSKGKYNIAKVKTGIIHLYCETIVQFIRKQRRRVRDYNYYNNLGLRKYPWGNIKKLELIKFCIYTLLVFPLIIQAFKGLLKNRDLAWLFHPIACWLTLFVYGHNMLISKFQGVSIESRETWKN